MISLPQRLKILSPSRHRRQDKMGFDGDAIGSRQVLYERFFSGDPIRDVALCYVSYDKTVVMHKVRAFLEKSLEVQRSTQK
jgi:hypothetical protein